MNLVRKCGYVAWWTTNNFRIDIKRMLDRNNEDGSVKLTETRWEDELIVKLKEVYEEEWLLGVRGDRKTRCIYQLSDELSMNMQKDDNVREINDLS